MKFILISIIVTPLIYLAIAFSLVFLPFKRALPEKSLDFDALNIEDFSDIVAVENHFLARDGSKLFYRYFPGKSALIVVLIHGSGSEGRYFFH